MQYLAGFLRSIITSVSEILKADDNSTRILNCLAAHNDNENDNVMWI